MIAVAALSARALVLSVRQGGERCAALDLFGDQDTRRAAEAWWPIGDASSMAIDGDRLLAALDRLAGDGRVRGWVAGSGFEGRPELLEAGAALLPLWGTEGAAVRRLRDPRAFFGFLREAGIAHPPVRHEAPADPAGWLLKDGGGCGGWQVRRAAAGDAPGPLAYWQAERRGACPMSATFVADGRRARVLGFNLQLVDERPARPYVFRGVIGPVPVADAIRARVADAASAIAQRHGLLGLGSLDFLLHEDRAEVIEVNPRPPASAALYAREGAWRAHRLACTRGVLEAVTTPAGVRGLETVFAPRALRWTAAAARFAARSHRVHDLPAAGTAFAAGDPVCSVSAGGRDAAAVQAALARRRALVLNLLEPAA